MKYKLCLYITEEKKYQMIDISEFFKDKKESFNLEKLDNFTMNFSDENELKNYLYSKKLISSDDLNKQLCIFFGSKDVREIPIIYSKDKETINNIKNLSLEIKSYFDYEKKNTYSTFSYGTIIGDYQNITVYFDVFSKIAKNTSFLKILQSYCKINPKQSLNINDIQLYINENSKYTKSRLLYIALFELFRRIFYRFDEKTKDLHFNYKGFRDFCVFYCDYKRNVNAKKDNLEEEYDDWREPIFPPNSEEEAAYQKYLEELYEFADKQLEEELDEDRKWGYRR